MESRQKILAGQPISGKDWTSESGFFFAYKEGLAKQILILVTGTRYNVCIYPDMPWNQSLENFTRQGWSLRPAVWGSEEFLAALEEQGWKKHKPGRRTHP